MPVQEHLLIAQGEDLNKAHALLAGGADQFEWQPQVYRLDALNHALQSAEGVKPLFVLPSVMHSDELTHIHAWICENAERSAA